MSTIKSLDARVTTLEASLGEALTLLTSIAAAVGVADQPAKVTPPAPAAPTQPKADVCTCTPEKRCSVCFVAWVRETAPARHARKESNREMAAWLRSKDLPTNGPVWEAAKAGNRSVRSLRAIAKANA